MIGALIMCETNEARLVQAKSKNFGCANATTIVEVEFSIACVS